MACSLRTRPICVVHSSPRAAAVAVDGHVDVDHLAAAAAAAAAADDVLRICDCALLVLSTMVFAVDIDAELLMMVTTVVADDDDDDDAAAAEVVTACVLLEEIYSCLPSVYYYCTFRVPSRLRVMVQVSDRWTSISSILTLRAHSIC
jgi:hypothetical protein